MALSSSNGRLAPLTAASNGLVGSTWSLNTTAKAVVPNPVYSCPMFATALFLFFAAFGLTLLLGLPALAIRLAHLWRRVPPR